MSRIYPPSLIGAIREAWAKTTYVPKDYKRPPLPNDASLRDLLETIYHASFLKEEGRKLEFRVIAYPVSKFKQEKADPIWPKRCAVFDALRDFSVAEIRRLAPAAESMRSMICVDLDERETWKIWGLLDTGSNWWEFINHETSGGKPPPPYLTISSANPGELVASAQGIMLLTLRNGATYSPQSDLLFTGIISRYFESTRSALYKECVKELKDKKWDPDGHDDGYPKRFYNFCLARIINAIRLKGHGGAVLLVPYELTSEDSRLTDRVTIKHACKYDFIWSLMVKSLQLHRQYYDQHFPLWYSKTPIEASAYKSLSLIESQREEVDEALSDCVRFIAGLSAVDGALVMSRRLRVLGFGGEVIAQSPTLRHVKLASDAAAKKTKTVTVEGYGTRHRSAFRFCSSYEDSVAFIVSQDGGIKAAKRVGPHVLMWPDVSINVFGV